jgi:hypothetical protein
MHGVAVVRQYAAHAPLHVSELPVAACKQQKAALACAVVRQGNLRGCHARAARYESRVTSHEPGTCTVRAAVSVWKLIQRPLAVVRRSAIASGESVSSSARMYEHASLPTIASSSRRLRSILKSSAQLCEATAWATSLFAARGAATDVFVSTKARCAPSTRARNAAHASSETQENAGAEWRRRGGRAEEEP